MCLDTKLSRKEKKAFLAKLPETFTVWKVMSYYNGTYCSWICHGGKDYVFSVGENIADSPPSRLYKEAGLYLAGFHSFLTKKNLAAWGGRTTEDRVVCCKMKKKWITDVGRCGSSTVIVSSRIICPKYVGKGK